MSTLEQATEFMWTHARLLERCVFACRFQGASAGHVADAVRAYRTDDGGFGHALEPDLRTPDSQPIFVDIALSALLQAGARDDELVLGACGYLERVANADGAVGPTLQGASALPCADHWRDYPDWAITPALNPTAGIAGLLHALGVEHPWRERATAWCIAQIEGGTFPSAHSLRCVTTLLEHLPDRKTAERLLDGLRDQLLVAEWFTTEVPVTTYTLTPLHFATRPDAPTRAWFEDDVIDAHLDDLVDQQGPDGGWPIHWQAPGPAATAAWRGRWTLEALLTLRAYDRV